MIQFQTLSDLTPISEFDCGNADLNTFFQSFALQNQKRRLGATRLATDASTGNLIGFYTLCLCHIERENLSKKFGGNLPREIPAVKLARLAIDKRYQGRGYGSILLAHALRSCYHLSEEFGGYVILVDAKPEARAFYERFGLKTIRIVEDDGALMGIRSRCCRHELLQLDGSDFADSVSDLAKSGERGNL